MNQIYSNSIQIYQKVSLIKSQTDSNLFLTDIIFRFPRMMFYGSFFFFIFDIPNVSFRSCLRQFIPCQMLKSATAIIWPTLNTLLPVNSQSLSWQLSVTSRATLKTSPCQLSEITSYSYLAQFTLCQLSELSIVAFRATLNTCLPFIYCSLQF